MRSALLAALSFALFLSIAHMGVRPLAFGRVVAKCADCTTQASDQQWSPAREQAASKVRAAVSVALDVLVAIA